jgi:uncharacterized protein YpuA (DUF1002 family)
MKHLHLLAAACLLAFAAIGCTKNPSAPTVQAIAASDAEIDVAGGSVTIDITSNSDWYVVSSAAWAKVAPVQGSGNGTVTVTCEPNTSGTARSATIIIYAGIDKNMDGRISDEDSDISMQVAKQSVKVRQAAGKGLSL